MEVRKLLLALLVALSAAPLRADRVLMAPCKGNRITGAFLEPRSGHAHGGVDWGLPVGSPVYAVDSGTVVFAGVVSGSGDLTKRGAGTLYLANRANTYDGLMTVVSAA